MKRFVVIFLIIVVLNVEFSSGGYKKRRPISEEDSYEDSNEDKNNDSNEDSACLDSIEDRKCGKNEKWYSSRSPCPKLCKSIGKECKLKRKSTPGCDCKPGFSRKKEDGPCIRNENCPNQRCPKNEIWLPSYKAPKYEETCENEYNSNSDDITRGGSDRSGCYCIAGYVRKIKKGKCIPKDQCSDDCPPGTEKRCIDPCEEYCDSNACLGAKTSSHHKCKNICACPEGEKKLSNGTCVSICPEDCKPNENLVCDYPCKNECDPNACDEVDLDLPCTYFCACQEGFKRDDNGDCIESDACVTCSDTEKYNPNFGCEDSCNENACLGTDQTGLPQNDCSCIDGYKRDALGDCVLKDDCYCKVENEEKAFISDQCENSCDRNACDGLELPEEKTKQCICVQGFLRSANGDCVEEWDADCNLSPSLSIQ